MEDDDEEKEEADKGGDGVKTAPTASKATVASREVVTVTPYVLPNPGPYPQVTRGVDLISACFFFGGVGGA